MASIKEIKKDVDYLVSEVISDCWVFIYMNQDKKTEEAVQVISDAIDLRNKLFDKINNPEKDNIKKHYKSINQELLTGVDALFNKVSQLAK